MKAPIFSHNLACVHNWAAIAPISVRHRPGRKHIISQASSPSSTETVDALYESLSYACEDYSRAPPSVVSVLLYDPRL